MAHTAHNALTAASTTSGRLEPVHTRSSSETAVTKLHSSLPAPHWVSIPTPALQNDEINDTNLPPRP